MAQSKNKTLATAADVEVFLDSISNPTRRDECIQFKAWLEDITGEPAVMWGSSIVGFGSYHYTYASGREGDSMKVGFSPRAKNLTLYIMPGFERYAALLSQLGPYKTGKSCLYIKKLADVNADVLKELMAEAYAYMTNTYG